MQLSGNPMPEHYQWLSVGIFSQYQAGYERKDSGERECSKQPFLYAKQCGETRRI